VPTIIEAGVPGYEAGTFWGILAPKGMPSPIVGRLDQELKAILASVEVKEGFLKLGAEVDYRGPIEFGKFLEEEVTRWESVVKKANIKLE
jgi:tripartite-type tricarboxylate transporter receptor subunit TctC